MEIVNGIPCFNCTDVERAKKPGAAASDLLHPSAQLQLKSDKTPAGVVQPIEAAERGVNRPLSSGERGTVLNFDI